MMLSHAPRPFLRAGFDQWSFFGVADVFVFLSGYVAAIAAREQPTAAAAIAKAARRAWGIYLIHLATLVAFLVVSSAFRSPALNVALAVPETNAVYGRVLTSAVSLQLQPHYNDILPLFVVLSLMAPLILWLLTRGPFVALAVVLLTYTVSPLLSRPFAGAFPSFNPIAWSVVFASGMACARWGSNLMGRINRDPRLAKWITQMACAVAVANLLCGIVTSFPELTSWSPLRIRGVKISPFNLANGIRMYLGDKRGLGPYRLLALISCVYLVAKQPRAARGKRTRAIVSTIALIGANGLPVFAFGVMQTAALWGLSIAWQWSTAAVASALVLCLLTQLLLATFLSFSRRSRPRSELPIIMSSPVRDTTLAQA